MNYSVLMAVYYKEKPIWFKKSIESMLSQTILTNDFIIVCDGPLTFELDQVIEEFESLHPGLFNIIRLDTNQGLANALQIGITNSKNEYLMRMDSDDYSYPNRAEIQLEYMNQGFDIVGGTISEFEGEDIEKDVIGYRYLPVTHKKIVKFAKKRSPFNHPTVMYKKSVVENAGGYLDFRFSEDYYLWVRIIQKGATCANTDKILVAMRSGIYMRKKRSGKALIKSRIALKKYMLKTKFINIFQFIFYTLGESFLLLLPLKLKELVFRMFLRSKNKKKN